MLRCFKFIMSSISMIFESFLIFPEALTTWNLDFFSDDASLLCRTSHGVKTPKGILKYRPYASAFEPSSSFQSRASHRNRVVRVIAVRVGRWRRRRGRDPHALYLYLVCVVVMGTRSSSSTPEGCNVWRCYRHRAISLIKSSLASMKPLR